METIKVLFNDCYGGFGFSPSFLAEYKARTGKEIKAAHARWNKELRHDPVAVAIWLEKGSAWCSDRAGSSIQMREIPAVFERYYEITDYDGDESVRVQVSDAMADALETFMEFGDREALNRQYAAICAGRDWMKEQPLPAPSLAEDSTPVERAPLPVVEELEMEDSPVLKSRASLGEEDGAAKGGGGYDFYGLSSAGYS